MFFPDTRVLLPGLQARGREGRCLESPWPCTSGFCSTLAATRRFRLAEKDDLEATLPVVRISLLHEISLWVAQRR